MKNGLEHSRMFKLKLVEFFEQVQSFLICYYCVFASPVTPSYLFLLLCAINV